MLTEERLKLSSTTRFPQLGSMVDLNCETEGIIADDVSEYTVMFFMLDMADKPHTYGIFYQSKLECSIVQQVYIHVISYFFNMFFVLLWRFSLLTKQSFFFLLLNVINILIVIFLFLITIIINVCTHIHTYMHIHTHICTHTHAYVHVKNSVLNPKRYSSTQNTTTN